MRKLIVVALLTVSLAGCASLQRAVQAAQLAFKTYSNPVTKTDLYKIETGLDIAITALDAYKKSCKAGAADVHCKANIATVQGYTRQVPVILSQLRSFVKNNDQVNAITLYNQATNLMLNLKSAAAQAGVTLGD